MEIDVSTIFQIAGVGIVVAFLHTVLKQMGKEDYAHWVTLVGFVYIIFRVVTIMDELFKKIKAVFLFQG